MRDSLIGRRLPIFVAILGFAILLALGSRVGRLDEPPAVKSPPAGFSAQLDIDASPTLRRASYNYSVIDGGAFNGQELKRAINRDPVVAQHYSDVDPSTMRPEILKADRLAYVSYRRGDRVYWTSHKVRIRSGETILTNGQTEIRARCGNCISMAPLMPTSPDEPDAMQLDALTDTGHPMLLEFQTDRPVLVSWPLSVFGPLATGETEGVPTGPQFGGPLGPFGASPFGPIADGQSDTAPIVVSIPGDFPVSGPGLLSPPPPDAINPLDQLDSLFEKPFAFEQRDLLLDSRLDVPATPPAALTPDVNETPVPEPATFLLLGGGLAGLIARRWRLIRT